MDEEDHNEYPDTDADEKSHPCSLASGILMMILGCLLFPFSFAFLNSAKESTFPIMIVAGLVFFTTGICFFCMHLGTRKRDSRHAIKTNVALNMTPVVVNIASPSPSPRARGPIHTQQNIIIDMPTTQTLSHSIDSNSLLYNDHDGASNSNGIYEQNGTGNIQVVGRSSSLNTARHHSSSPNTSRHHSSSPNTSRHHGSSPNMSRQYSSSPIPSRQYSSSPNTSRHLTHIENIDSTTPCLHNTDEDEPPPSYDFVMRQMQSCKRT